jgi:hypothetical protein
VQGPRVCDLSSCHHDGCTPCTAHRCCYEDQAPAQAMSHVVQGDCRQAGRQVTSWRGCWQVQGMVRSRGVKLGK